MTEIPEHLMKRAAAARRRAEVSNEPDKTLDTTGLSVAVYINQTDGPILVVNAPNLSTPSARLDFSDRVASAVVDAVRAHNRDKIVTAEVDVDGIARALGSTPEDVADALGRVRGSVGDRLTAAVDAGDWDE